MTDPAASSDPVPMRLCGQIVLADPTGALMWPEERLLVVSDLHLEKGSWYAARGVHLPPYDSRTTLGRLNRLIEAHRPERVMALGDSFHDRAAAERLSGQDREMIRGLTDAHDWIWIAGNHDPEPPADLGGRAEHTVEMGPFIFRHEPADGPAPGEVAGHLHPCAIVRVRGRRLRRRCFASDTTRLVMPAFGAYTGGLDVLNEAFAPVFPGPFHAWLMGTGRVFPVAHDRLVPDGAWSEGAARPARLSPASRSA